MKKYLPEWRPPSFLARYPALFVFLGYALASILITWPLVFHLDSSVFGDYGDSRGVVWGVWAQINGFLNTASNDLIAAPFGQPIGNGVIQPIADAILHGLARLSNEIVAYNLSILLAFPLTAIATYFLLSSLLDNRVVAFIGGLVFAFSPAVVMHFAGGHTNYGFNAFIPLFLWALFNNQSKRTFISAFWVAASFVCIALTNLYFGYFAIYIAIYFLAFDVLSRKDEVGYKVIFKNYIYCAIISICLMLLFLSDLLFRQFSVSSDGHIKLLAFRDFSNLVVYSSRPWEFFIPSIDHPFLGRYVFDFVHTHLHGSNVFEQTLYLGLVPIVLFIAGVVFVLRRKMNAPHRSYFIFFAFGALWMYFLSLPPFISIGSLSIPSVSYFAYALLPMFRGYVRFGILVNFFVACSAAVVLTHLYQHMRRARFFAMLAILVSLLAFEYRSIPSGYAQTISTPPTVYSWLAQQPSDIIVAEYPMMQRDDASFYTYLFWQRIHKKKLVNGAARDNEKAWEFFEKVNDLGRPQTPDLLRSVGVKYIIVHANMYQDGPVPAPIKRYYPDEFASATYNNGQVPVVPFPLKLVNRFGSDFVFSWEEGKNNPGHNSLPQPPEGDL